MWANSNFRIRIQIWFNNLFWLVRFNLTLNQAIKNIFTQAYLSLTSLLFYYKHTKILTELFFIAWYCIFKPFTTKWSFQLCKTKPSQGHYLHQGSLCFKICDGRKNHRNCICWNCWRSLGTFHGIQFHLSCWNYLCFLYQIYSS